MWKSVFDEQMCDFISFTMRCTAEIGADIIKSSSDKKKKAMKTFLAYCARSEDVSKINAALQRASSMLVKHIIELDTNQLLLNVRNGIVDLQTGQLLQAVLDWLVQGAVDWCRNGLPELPNSVKVEMNKYYEDNDWLADALEELTVPDSSGRIKAIVLLEAIYDWLGHFGRNSDYTRSSLVELISKHGYSYKRIHGTRYFCGLSIKPGTNSEAANDESQETTSMQWDDPVPPPPEHPGNEELAVE